MANCSACIHSTVCVSAFDPEVLEPETRCVDFLEESKITIKPCEIGDIVWCVGTKCLSGNYEEECNEQNGCTFCHLNEERVVFSREVEPYFLAGLLIKGSLFDPENNFVWGKTVFETEEKAWKALERMNSHEALV